MRVRLVRRKEDDGDLRRFTHRLHPLSWAMHDKRAVERSSQGPAVPEPRLLFLVLVGWAGLAGWRLRRQMEQREQATPSAFGQSVTFPPPSSPSALGVMRSVRSVCCMRSTVYTIYHAPTIPAARNSSTNNTPHHSCPTKNAHSAASHSPCLSNDPRI